MVYGARPNAYMHVDMGVLGNGAMYSLPSFQMSMLDSGRMVG